VGQQHLIGLAGELAADLAQWPVGSAWFGIAASEL
jgi:hypothetical protein